MDKCCGTCNSYKHSYKQIIDYSRCIDLRNTINFVGFYWGEECIYYDPISAHRLAEMEYERLNNETSIKCR